MILLYDSQGMKHSLTDYTDYRITHKEDGNDTLTFLFDTELEQYSLLQEECVIEANGNEWIIKKIDDDKIDCELNFDFLKQSFYKNYESKTRSLSQVLESHLPAGWTIEGANVSSIRRSIEFDFCTDYDIIQKCLSVYEVRFVWHITEKRLVVYNPSMMQPTGEYITDELNLRKLEFKGNSTNFATRLYAYGNGGMTLADAMVDDGNGGTVRYGLEYVEDRTYCDKVICAYWSDDRYTVPENLYADALKKLSVLSQPERTYECDVVDLAKQDPRYHFLDFAMHKKITLVDRRRKVRVEHQIVEYVEWPDDPDENKVTISRVAGTIQDSIRTASQAAGDVVEHVQTSMQERIAMATAMLTGAFGGYLYHTDNELFIMDTDDPATAQVVWRWNVNGFGKSSTGIDGPYTTALTFDDTFITNVINAMIIRGDHIEAGSIDATQIKQSYTDGVLNESFEAAQGYVQFMADQLTEYLTNDSETGQLDVIKQTITNIRESIEGLSAKFQNGYRGGINYVENSAGLNGVTDEWSYTGTVVTLQNSDTKNRTVSNSCFRLSANATLSQEIGNIVVGQPYAVSMKVKKAGDSPLLSQVKIIYNGDSEIVVFSSSDNSDWQEVTCVLENVEAPILTIEATTRSSYLYLSDIMICEGTDPKAWTPAPNEIYTSEVKIDKNGIEVTREATSEKTVINNHEFAGYYQNQEMFSLNKDETRIKNAVVSEKMTIGDCLFIPYKNSYESGMNIILLD